RFLSGKYYLDMFCFDPRRSDTEEAQSYGSEMDLDRKRESMTGLRSKKEERTHFNRLIVFIRTSKCCSVSEVLHKSSPAVRHRSISDGAAAGLLTHTLGSPRQAGIGRSDWLEEEDGPKLQDHFN
ncbi:hypothetical protein KUCAC02_032688, partial [Chaenocephalus aceratus]